MTFLEYRADPVATTQVHAADGWVTTGDRGQLDAKGYFHFVGRRDDVIRRRGETLSVSDLQAVIARLPGVADVIVIGVDSDYTEQDVLVAVEREADRSWTATEIHAWCTRELPRAAWPRYIYVGALPRTASTKVDLARLRTPQFRALAADFDRVGVAQ
jgi:crotonobetaine/carnitine-CoA ligase